MFMGDDVWLTVFNFNLKLNAILKDTSDAFNSYLLEINIDKNYISYCSSVFLRVLATDG